MTLRDAFRQADPPLGMHLKFDTFPVTLSRSLAEKW